MKTMRNIIVATLVVFASLFVLGAGQVSASIVTGTVYFVTDPEAGDATPATVAGLPGTDLGASFSAPSTPLAFASGGLYTLGEFLLSGGAFGFSFFNGHALTDSLSDTLFDFKGMATVTTGDTFVAGHDDGLTLVIGSVTVISEPGPTGFSTTTRTYTGSSGTFPFELVFGECCGPPAALDITLPLISTPVPEPATLALLGLGLAGLGFARRRKQ